MRKRIVLAASFFFLAGCSQLGSQSNSALNDSAQLDCPLVVDDDPLYTLAVPCATVRAEPSNEVPMADFESYFIDDQGGQVYLVLTIAQESMPMYSSSSATQAGGSFRYGGRMLTSSGDVLILATGYLTTGARITYGYGLLADGRMLIIGTEYGNPLTTSFLGSVDLAGTDGSDIGTAVIPGIPALVAPAPDGLTLLDDNTAYRVVGSSDLQRLASWSPGALIMVQDASLASSSHDFFLTNRSEWISVEADYVGVFSRSTISSIADPQQEGTEVVLADNSSWRVDNADKGEVGGWRAGDEVAILEDPASALGYTMIRLSTGQTAGFQPH